VILEEGGAQWQRSRTSSRWKSTTSTRR
jgi:hypothetical protein